MVGLDETRADLSRTTDDYVYDGNGKRLIKVSNERGPGGTPLVTTRTLYIGNLYEEEIPNGQNARAYTVYYMMGQKLVGLRRANWQGQSNGQYRIVGDMLGSTTLLVDTSTSPGPQVVQRQYYKPYGEVAFSWGSSRTSIGYTGQRLDSESGLMYYGARYYDPVLSFFTQADPTVPDAGNLKDYNKYLYVRGNPLRYLDSLGYGPEDYYIFVQGCISGEGKCERNSPDDWGEYGKYLYQQWLGWIGDEEIERLSTQGKLGSTWKTWWKAHTRFVPASNPGSGAENIRNTIAGISDRGPGVDINLIGHSMGGAAVAQYLIDAEAGNGFDSRINSAVMIDAPLVSPVIDRSKLANALRGATHRGMQVLVVDTPNDWVSHPPIPGLNSQQDIENPTYPNGPTEPFFKNPDKIL